MEQSPPAENLAWTGERLATTCHGPLVYEHLHRYAVAFGLAQGKRILDIACGEGYGANLLAFVAAKVIGVDLDAGRIAHAKAKTSATTWILLKAVTKDLLSQQNQMDRLRSSTWRKLIFPFGKSQRKVQQVTASRREDD